MFDEYHVGDLNELHINIGNGRLSSIQVVNTYSSTGRSKEEIILDKVNNIERKPVAAKNDIIVRGIDEIKANIAACCKPIPGDEIVGYISKGNGINVHRTVCPNVSEEEERIIDVSWNDEISKKYSTDLLISADDNKDLLLNIISKTSGSDITIQSINSHVNGQNRHLVTINVLVSDTEKLEKFMHDLMMIPQVTNVERNIK